MDAKAFAQELKAVFEKLNADGVTQVNTANVAAYLEQLINSLNEETTNPTSVEIEHYKAMEREYYKAQLQGWAEQQKHSYAQNIEMFRSVITAGQNALRSSFLMNGGATVALLAFIGKLTDNAKAKIPLFVGSLSLFVLGVLLITGASGCTYLGQRFYAPNEKSEVKVAYWLNIASILLGLASYIAFICGAVKALHVFLLFA